MDDVAGGTDSVDREGTQDLYGTHSGSLAVEHREHCMN